MNDSTHPLFSIWKGLRGSFAARAVILRISFNSLSWRLAPDSLHGPRTAGVLSSLPHVGTSVLDAIDRFASQASLGQGLTKEMLGVQIDEELCVFQAQRNEEHAWRGSGVDARYSGCGGRGEIEDYCRRWWWFHRRWKCDGYF